MQPTLFSLPKGEQPMRVVSSYAQNALRPESRNLIIEDALKVLTPIADSFDVLAFQGMSGAVMAPILAHLLGKGLLFVRKGDSYQDVGSGEARHSSLKVEGPCGHIRFLIVDDFIAGGSTVRRIHKHVTKYNPFATCVGVYLWRSFRDMDTITIGLENVKIYRTEARFDDVTGFWPDVEETELPT